MLEFNPGKETRADPFELEFRLGPMITWEPNTGKPKWHAEYQSLKDWRAPYLRPGRKKQWAERVRPETTWDSTRHQVSRERQATAQVTGRPGTNAVKRQAGAIYKSRGIPNRKERVGRKYYARGISKRKRIRVATPGLTNCKYCRPLYRDAGKIKGVVYQSWARKGAGINKETIVGGPQ